ncbi:SGNH/GDSL hydrolase family protein [Novosphingobium rosa]|uniref:SGNH/GDSL hydrolase family protein n=1 Tax=Novosphingobium rosa TaxID=76978 RepID=UPI0008346310|nr:SGNH/GDSL hydrolase family protein [Novosphingobium rosa]
MSASHAWVSRLCRVLLPLSLVVPAPAFAETWVAGWLSPGSPPVALKAGTSPAIFENQTVRQTLRLGIGARRIRLRLTNEYGRMPLAVGDVRIALADPRQRVIPGSERKVMFAGQDHVTLPAGAPIVSDALDLSVSALQTLVVSVYYPQAGMPGGHLSRIAVAPGDRGAEAAMQGAESLRGPGIVSAVEVVRDAPAPVIVAFGDSIVEGIAKTSSIDMGWPQQLASRFARDPARAGWSIVNAGIGGNRLLHDGFAAPGLARFDRDVLAVPGVTHVILLEGINDIGWSALPDSIVTAEMVMMAQRQLVERAHARGVQVIGATLLPFKGAVYYTPKAEAMRVALNRFIRTSGIFDGVVDFDQVTADPADPACMNPAFDDGDHLHPNDAGNTAMAAAVSSALFEERQTGRARHAPSKL